MPIMRCQTLHAQRNRPDVILWRVRAANAFGGLAVVEIGIVFAQYKPARGAIEWVVGHAISHVRHGQEAWHICIVHQIVMAQSIDLISVNLAVCWMFDDGVSLDARFHRV